MKRFSMVLLSVLLLASFVFAQTTSMDVTYTWSVPATGSAVDHYRCQVSYNNGSTWNDLPDVTTNEFTSSFPVGVNHIIRVAGVDLQDRMGPWSASSDPYNPDPGPPGSCGKPARK